MSVPATSPSVALSSPPTGMEERARLVGGEFAIHARRRGGTTIVVMAPA
ncbi:MAG TPA: hypothetical protein VF302_11455 [Candidatus Limnocylindrales bacterium]